MNSLSKNFIQLQNVWQNSLKILWANFIKLLNHLLVFTSLHRQYYVTLPSSVSMWSNIWKVFFFLDLLVQKLFFNKNNPIPPPFYLKSISLLLISATLLYLSTFHHVCLLLAKKLASQKKTIAFDENFFATPHQVT